MVFSTLYTKYSKEGSLSGDCVLFLTVYRRIPFMFLWWTLRRAEYRLGDLKFHSSVLHVSLTLQWQCCRRVENKNKTKWNAYTNWALEEPSQQWIISSGTCFGREPCSFKLDNDVLVETVVPSTTQQGNAESWEKLGHKWERRLDIAALVTSQMWEAFVLVQPQLRASRMWSTILVMKSNLHLHWDSGIFSVNTNLLRHHNKQLIYI